jgi:rabenosyn-5
LRRQKRDVGRIERTKLERRLEKLIALHFPLEGTTSSQKEKTAASGRPGLGPNGRERRASSFFDLDFEGLRNSLRDDPGSLLKGVLGQNQVDMRAAEQRITPWQEDASVSKCICCSSSFHPITNRKHHCRLCGEIICSLPPKRPQRPVPCSFLFVVDPRTRRIEEVQEGVDYGVRKRTSSTVGPTPRGKKASSVAQEDEEKFLKGVRVCRLCRPIIMRQQFQQEFTTAPTFVRLYDAFISLEAEIEDSLPQFQEMVLTLNNSDSPDLGSGGQDSKTLSAVRKRLLGSFAQYDALAKKIHSVTLPSQDGRSRSTRASAIDGPGSQERVVMAIMMRANLFLQKNMVPLQSLPGPKSRPQPMSPSGSASGLPDPNASSSGKPGHTNRDLIDPDSTLALGLQPLLEQEALLESFVEEASAHRKFEDAKTLKSNLREVRDEISRVLREGGVEVESGGGRKAGRKR